MSEWNCSLQLLKWFYLQYNCLPNTTLMLKHLFDRFFLLSFIDRIVLCIVVLWGLGGILYKRVFYFCNSDYFSSIKKITEYVILSPDELTTDSLNIYIQKGVLRGCHVKSVTALLFHIKEYVFPCFLGFNKLWSNPSTVQNRLVTGCLAALMFCS